MTTRNGHEDLTADGSRDDPMVQVLSWLARRQRMLLPIGAAGGGLLWFLSGFYIVGPGEVGVVQTFGRETARTESGLRYRLSWPFEQVTVVNVEQINRIEVGFRSERGVTQRVPEEALMLTGDANIVEAQMIVQYRVADPSGPLFRLQNAEQALHAATQVALRTTVGSMPIEEVLTVGRAKAQDDTRVFVQRLLDTYESGLAITEVKLLVVDPPEAVKDAFHDVVRAREDRERLTNQAMGYQADIMPKARGTVQQLLREAEAYQEQRVLRAQGDASRFTQLLAEYLKAPAVTRERLYLETAERVFADVDKIIVEKGIGERIVPLLPLGQILSTGAQTAPANLPAQKGK